MNCLRRAWRVEFVLRWWSTRSWFGIAILLAAVIFATVAVPLSLKHASVLGQVRRHEALFEWFSSSGIPSSKGMKWVHLGRLPTHGGRDRPDRSPFAVDGFLVSETLECVTVLLGNFRIAQVWRREEPWLEPDGELVMDSTVSLDEYIRKLLASIRDNSAQPMGLSGDNFAEYVGLPAQALWAAWAAEEHGLQSLSSELIDATDSLLGGAHRPDSELIRSMQESLATVVFGRIVINHGDPTISRVELVRRLTDYQSAFPRSPLRDDCADLLRRDKLALAAEALMAESPVLVPLVGSDDATLRGLVMDLASQCGAQLSQPGTPSIWADPRRDMSPAHRLLAAGLRAVPMLLTALEDSRASRTVGYERSGRFSHYVVSVGDIALVILETMAKQRFCRRASMRLILGESCVVSDVREAVSSWWGGVR